MSKIKDEGRIPLVSGVSVVSYSVDRLDWVPVEEAADVTFTADQRKRLVDALDSYFTAETFERMRPVAKDVNRRLGAIARHAKGLADALNTRDEVGEVAVGAVWAWRSVPVPTEIKAMLRRLALTARWHRAEKGKSGRTRKDARRELVEIAATIWHKAGAVGRGAHWDNYNDDFRGKLLDMITEMVAQKAGKKAAKAEKRGITEAIKTLNQRQ